MSIVISTSCRGLNSYIGTLQRQNKRSTGVDSNENLIEMASCSICLDIAKIPVCCIPCGHVFCNACIQRWIFRIRGDFTVHAFHLAAAECPQCRCVIEGVQKVRFDASNTLYEDILPEDPWNESDVGNIVKSASNIWKRSQVRYHLTRFQEHIMSNDRVKGAWHSFKDGCRSTRRFVNEFNSVEAGFENKVNWLRTRCIRGSQHLKTKVLSHPYTESFKSKWNGLSDDWKFVITMVIFISVLIMAADVQNSEGFLQSVIGPVFSTVLHIFRELFVCLVYIVYRPIFCSFLCTMEVAATIADVVVEIMMAFLKIFISLCLLPVTMATGLFHVLTLVIGTLLKTFLPLFVLAYVLSPTVQHHCRSLLTRLQQNVPQQQQQHTGAQAPRETEI